MLKKQNKFRVANVKRFRFIFAILFVHTLNGLGHSYKFIIPTSGSAELIVR